MTRAEWNTVVVALNLEIADGASSRQIGSKMGHFCEKEKLNREEKKQLPRLTESVLSAFGVQTAATRPTITAQISR
jgi:hypothetical protein